MIANIQRRQAHVLLTTSDLVGARISLQFLEALESMDVSSPIEVMFDKNN
jgi:hypothetical protein